MNSSNRGSGAVRGNGPEDGAERRNGNRRPGTKLGYPLLRLEQPVRILEQDGAMGHRLRNPERPARPDDAVSAIEERKT